MERFAKWYVETILSKQKLVTLTLIVISVLLGLYAVLGLRINADITGLAPKDDPRFQDLVKYTSEKVTSNTLIVAIDGVKTSNPDSIAKMIKELFENTPYVNHAEPFDNPETLVKYGMLSFGEGTINDTIRYYQSLTRVEPKTLVDFRFWRNVGSALYDLHSYIQGIVEKSGIKKYYLLSPDKELLVMNFSMKKPMSDVKFVTEAVRELKKLSKKFEDQHNVKIYFTGGVMSTYEANLQASKDFTLTTFISLVAIILIIIIGFGNIFELLILFTGLLMAMGITLGLIALLLKELNIVTTFVNAMLLGMGIDYAMYIVTRIQERFNMEGISRQSIVDAFIENFRPAFISMTTTSLAFLGMLLSPSNAIKQMGFSVALGVVVYFFVFNTLVPIAHDVLLPKFKGRQRETYVRVVDIVRKSRVLMTLTIITTLLLSAVGIYSIINFSYTTSSLIPKKSETNITSELISKKFGSIASSDVVIAAETSEELQNFLEKLKENGLITSDFSILTFIQNPEKIAEEKSNIYVQVLEITNTPFLEILFRKYGLYESFVSTVDVIRNISSTEDLFKLMEKDIPSLFYEDIHGKKYLLAFVTPAIEIWKGNNIKTFFESIKKIGNIRTYGYTTLFYGIIEELLISTTWVFGIVFLIEFIILYIDFRNVRKSWNIIFLTTLNTLAAFGISYLVGIKTTFITFIVLPIFLGIGVDSLVELDHSIRYGKESIIKTEKAVIMSVLTTVASFGSFVFAQGQLLREFGFVTSAGLIGALLISLCWYLNTAEKSYCEFKKVEASNFTINKEDK
uniref:RND transporter n=1 Tax=Fervidobacterium pennivorans TaxID=93466 RepID=A0A7V4NE51_FERPE